MNIIKNISFHLNQKTPQNSEVYRRELLYPGTEENTNYFTFNLTGYMYKYKLVNTFKYTTISAAKVKPKKETMIERKIRYQKLIDENNWSRSELSRELGVSTAWVSMVLNS